MNKLLPRSVSNLTDRSTDMRAEQPPNQSRAGGVAIQDWPEEGPGKMPIGVVIQGSATEEAKSRPAHHIFKKKHSRYYF